MSNDNIISWAGCPKCGAEKGNPCVTKSGNAWMAFGRRGFRVHPEREKAAMRAVRRLMKRKRNPDDPDLLSRVRVETIEDPLYARGKKGRWVTLLVIDPAREHPGITDYRGIWLKEVEPYLRLGSIVAEFKVKLLRKNAKAHKIFVDESYGRRGVASAIYRYVEDKLGGRVAHSTDQSVDGRAYARGRRGWGTILRGNPSKADFIAIGREQRGAAEDAMVRAQFAVGGGVLSFVIEHVGDLIHRMNDPNTWEDAGYGYVKDKVEKTLRSLEHPYGFSREHAENVKGNARYYEKRKGLDPREYRRRYKAALKRYADEHRKLPEFNEAHEYAKMAAVALGEEEFATARFALRQLKLRLGSRERWVRYARQGLE